MLQMFTTLYHLLQMSLVIEVTNFVILKIFCFCLSYVAMLYQLYIIEMIMCCEVKSEVWLYGEVSPANSSWALEKTLMETNWEGSAAGCCAVTQPHQIFHWKQQGNTLQTNL